MLINNQTPLSLSLSYSISPKPNIHAHMSAPALHSPHLRPCSYYVRLSPVDCFSEYCSNTEPVINHIALSPRRTRLALRPPTARLGLASPPPWHPLCTVHQSNCKSRLLPWWRWLEERSSPWTVNHVFLCSSHPEMLPVMHWVWIDGTRCIPTEKHRTRLIRLRWDFTGRTHFLLNSVKNISVKSLDIWIFTFVSYAFLNTFSRRGLKDKLIAYSVWDIWSFFLRQDFGLESGLVSFRRT